MIHESSFWVVIPAAGSGQRYGNQLAKQYLMLHGKTILEHSIDLFIHKKGLYKVILALAKDDPHFSNLSIANHRKVQVVVGGESRAESVLNGLKGLQSIAKPLDWVLVHDAVRPCLHQNDLHLLMQSVQDDHVGGILATPVADTIKSLSSNSILHTVPRDNLCHALTPQMFRYGILFDALQHCLENKIAVTDESSSVEHIGLKPKVVFAQYPNPKLTLARDLSMIAHLLALKHQEEVLA
ncbi:MAG: 2-C-methyl-D-erythritol 4-phosphate cytidylyltransferase [Gammaproteobacteria bacterium]|jgi:2-C-methyl-D-erythritol 4-phosphate cytidylyltransferase|nr:2-C-methyl-D-erythritol 4-phosphate cytidylyltransferase [Gammaproteobacteria bacterium]